MKVPHMNHPVVHRCLALVPVAVAGLLVVGCRSEAAPGAGAAPPPPEVTVAPVEESAVVEWAEFTGRTEAMEMVEVRPRVSGHVQEVHFESGQAVKQGDLLFKIDPALLQAEYDLKEAEYQQALVRQETAEREAARTEGLLAGRAISSEEAEQRGSRLGEARAAATAAKAARETARLNLEYTEVRSPINGRVSRALITRGNYVSGIPGAASVLTTVVSVDPVYVYADVDERSLLRFNDLRAKGKISVDDKGRVPVELQLGDEAGFRHQGHLESLDNRVDAQTGSILLRAVFSNPETPILPGLFARIRLPLSANTPRLLVDESAIGTDQSQKFVLTLTETNTAAYRPVKLGFLVDGKRVIEEGLAPGERIIVNGLAKVQQPGMAVTPVEAEPASKPVALIR